MIRKQMYFAFYENLLTNFYYYLFCKINFKNFFFEKIDFTKRYFPRKINFTKKILKLLIRMIIYNTDNNQKANALCFLLKSAACVY